MKEKWYKLLLEERFLNFFTDPDSDYSMDADGVHRRDPVFREFCDLIDGMTFALTFENAVREHIKNNLHNSKQREAFLFVNTCMETELPYAPILFTGIREKDWDLQRMNDEELAMMILYPFWSRMGGSYEEADARSGNLGEKLLRLKDLYEQACRIEKA